LLHGIEQPKVVIMLKFLKSAILNGLLILLPFLFLIVIIKEFLELMIGLATPIADLFPSHIIDSFPDINILAVLLILGSSLVVGILARLPVGASIGRYFEQKILDKVPVYRPLKTLLGALLGSEASENFKPAFILRQNDELEPAYIVEDTGRPRVVVLIPWTPNSFAGSLKLVPRECVHRVDLSLDEFSLSLGHYGVGLSKLLPDAPEELLPGKAR
jgi:uncharacterized membrane protein